MDKSIYLQGVTTGANFPSIEKYIGIDSQFLTLTKEEPENTQIATITSPIISYLTCIISGTIILTGAWKDYPSFREDCKNIMEGELEDPIQRSRIKTRCQTKTGRTKVTCPL